MSDATVETTRRPGRPRSARVERAILAAALHTLVEDGYEGMSIEGVAARAAVGKATIYRRWAGKEELVGAALLSLNQDVVVPDTGSVREDMHALAGEFHRHTLESPIGPVIGRLVSATITSPGLNAIFQETIFRERRAAARAVIRRGIERGQVRPEIDVEMAVDLLAGPVIMRVLFGGAAALSEPGFPERLIDLILGGIAVDGPTAPAAGARRRADGPTSSAG